MIRVVTPFTSLSCIVLFCVYGPRRIIQLLVLFVVLFIVDFIGNSSKRFDVWSMCLIFSFNFSRVCLHVCSPVRDTLEKKQSSCIQFFINSNVILNFYLFKYYPYQGLTCSVFFGFSLFFLNLVHTKAMTL
jgi:hypothetical protein